jgi:phenylalanyl-tRNA synthetase beta chain
MEQFNIKGQVFYADFDWDYLFSLLKADNIRIGNLPKFPSVRRDLSLLIDKGVTFKSIRDLAFKTERKLLKLVELFDVYEGKGMASGKKSYAVSFVLQDATKTLNDKTIDKAMGRIQQVLEQELGARLRG